MERPAKNNITDLLKAWRQGDRQSAQNLMSLVFQELREIAHAYLSRERSGHTLQTTALVNEAYIRLARDANLDWRDRAHFFGFAARIMRQVLVEYARARLREKRGQGLPELSLDEAQGINLEKTVSILSLEEALNDLYRINKRQSRIVEFRYFGGLKNQEIATILNVSEGTVKRDWNVAKAWIFSYLKKT